MSQKGTRRRYSGDGWRSGCEFIATSVTLACFAYYGSAARDGQSKLPFFFYWAILNATSGGDLTGEVVE